MAVTKIPSAGVDQTGSFDFTSGLTLGDNLLFDASSKGVYLGVTSATPANLLDDYEEGSFTPQYRGSAGSGTPTYTDQVGRYTKIGRVVHIQIRLVLSNKSTYSSGGTVEIYGLPFSVTNVGAPPPAAVELRQVNLPEHTAIASFSDGNTFCHIKFLRDNDNPTQCTHADLEDNAVFIINGSYIHE